MTATASIAFKPECQEQMRLRGQVAQAIKVMIKMHVCHHTALMIGDPRALSLENEMDAAAQEWQFARQSYLAHRTSHGC